MLNTVIINISQFNEDDSLEQFLQNTSFNCITEISKGLCTDESFLITDNRNTADAAKALGIGFAAYLLDDKISDEQVENEFPDSLYLITSICELSDEVITRMYQREKNLPWTILETERTIVREMTLLDLDALYEIYSDAETIRYIENLYENRYDEMWFTDTYIKHQYRYFEYGLWAVTDKSSGALIGRAGIFNREGFINPELGFVFDRSRWGEGIAYEVCSAILEYSREEFGFDIFIAFTKSENVRGKRLLERLNFEYKDVTCLNDEWFDMYELNPRLYPGEA